MVAISVSDRGGGHPCAMCQARMADKYLRTVTTDTGSNGIPSAKAGSTGSGSVDAQRAKACMSLGDAGRRSSSGMENVSQKASHFCRPEP